MDSNQFKGAGGGGGSRTPTRTPDTLLSQDYVEIILGLCQGPIKGLIPGTYGPLENFYLGETAAQNKTTGKSNFNDFKITQYRGRSDDPEIKRVLGGDASNMSIGVQLAQGIEVIRTTPATVRKSDISPGINRIEVRLLFSQLVKQNDDGYFEHTAKFRISHKATTSPTWIDYEGKAESTITGKTTGGYVKDFLIDVTPLEDADYEVRVIKLSPDNEEENVVEMSWESLQMVTLGRPKYEGLAAVHIFGRVSEQFSSLPDMSGVYDGRDIIKIPTNYNPVTRVYDEATPWDGTFKTDYTNNPAWILYHLITDPDIGLAHYYKNISANRGEFYAAAKWCDEQVPSGVPGQTQPRFTFNDLIDTQRMGMELLMYIAGSFNSTIYDGGNGVIRLRTDRYTTPKQLFTPENVTKAGFTYTFTDVNERYNDITVQFINPTLDWEMDERQANIDASEWVERNGRIPYSFVAVGCTNVHEAVRRANDRLLTCNTEVTTVNFETTRFGFLADLYDTILIADPISGWSTGGRVKSVQGSTIQLRDPVYATTTASRMMRVQTYTGLAELLVAPPSIGLVYSLEVMDGTFPTNVPDRTVFTLEDNQTLGVAKPFRVVSITEGEGEGAGERYQISATEINVNKYEDSANGTESDPVIYDFTTPGEPVLPLTILVENLIPSVSTDGSLIYRLRVSWERPFQAYTKYYEIDYAEHQSGTWKTERVYGEDTYLQPLKDGVGYDIRLFAVTPTGRRSSKAVEVFNFVVSKKVSILENVTGLNVTQTNKGWVASWNPPVNLPDIAGTRLKYSNPPKGWEELPNLYLTPALTQELPWFLSGVVGIQAKYIDTSNNESMDAAVYNLTILPPAQPQVTVNSSFGAVQVTMTDPTTSQPLAKILVRRGNDSSTWENAGLGAFELGTNQTTFTVNPDATQATRVFIRAVDVAGNQGAIALVEVPPGANSVGELLDMVKGDIDETWITPGLLERINYGDPELDGSLAQRLQTLSSQAGVFYRIVAAGWGNNVAPGPGIYKDGVKLVDQAPMWTAVTVNSNNALSVATTWDTLGSANNPATVNSMISYLNGLPDGTPVILFTYDEPASNTSANANWRAAMKRCGASDVVLLKMAFRCAYVLAGIAGIGEGQGVERLTNPPNGNANATGNIMAEYFVQVINGRFVSLGTPPLAATIQNEISTRASETGYLGAQWAVRAEINSNGKPVIGGIALAGTSSGTAGPQFDFSIRANKIAFLPPAGQGESEYAPFVYYTTTTTLPSGVVVQPGMYVKRGFIEEVTADRIDTRGLTVKDNSGNVILGSGQGLPEAYRGAVGGNLLYNADFASNSDGWVYQGGTIGQSEWGVNLSSAWAIAPLWGPGNNVLWSRQAGTVNDQNGYYDITGKDVPVEPGKRYMFSAYTGAHRCVVHVYLMLFNSSNQLVGFSTDAGAHSGPSCNVEEAGGGPTISGYKRIWCYADIPSNVTRIVPVFRKWDTFAGNADSYLFAGRCKVEQVGALSTTPGPWSATLSDPTNVRATNPITRQNVTTFISGVAITYAQIEYVNANQVNAQSLSAITATIGLLRTATSGARMEIASDYQKIFDGSNAKRVQIGNLNA